MRLLSEAVSAAGVSAFVGAALLGPDRLWSGRPGRVGSHFGTRRPHPPPPGRRVPPLASLGRGGWGGTGAGRRSDRARAAAWARPGDLRPLLVRSGRSRAAAGRAIGTRAGRQAPCRVRAGPVADRLRPDPVAQDVRSGRPGDPGVGGTGDRRQRQDRPARAHHRRIGAPSAPSCASIRPGRRAWILPGGLRSCIPNLARSPTGGRRPDRCGEDVGGPDDRRRLLVRHGHQDAGPAPLRGCVRWPRHGRRRALGRQPRRRAR